MKYFVSEKKRIFADISLKEVIEKAKNSNPVTKDVECKAFKLVYLLVLKNAHALSVARIGGEGLSVAEQWSAKSRNPG